MSWKLIKRLVHCKPHYKINILNSNVYNLLWEVWVSRRLIKNLKATALNISSIPKCVLFLLLFSKYGHFYQPVLLVISMKCPDKCAKQVQRDWAFTIHLQITTKAAEQQHQHYNMTSYISQKNEGHLSTETI